MTRNGLSRRPDRLVGEAIGLMLDNQISGLPVMDDEARRFVGRRGMFTEILSLIPRLPAPAAPA
jgi:predicted transcriptional regulator